MPLAGVVGRSFKALIENLYSKFVREVAPEPDSPFLQKSSNEVITLINSYFTNEGGLEVCDEFGNDDLLLLFRTVKQLQ